MNNGSIDQSINRSINQSIDRSMIDRSINRSAVKAAAGEVVALQSEAVEIVEMVAVEARQWKKKRRTPDSFILTA